MKRGLYIIANYNCGHSLYSTGQKKKKKLAPRLYKKKMNPVLSQFFFLFFFFFLTVHCYSLRVWDYVLWQNGNHIKDLDPQLLN